MEDRETRRDSPTANPGYAAFQIARALATAEQHGDPATRERAQQRVATWASVLTGMMNGTLAVGSRTPLDKVPAWVTPAVVTGGFVTGALMAEGPLQDHERALLETLSVASDPEPRRRLNAHFVTDAGLARLQDALRTGNYDVSVPEEGALLVVAWLVANGQAERARQVLDQLAPFFDRLRFYPVPSERPRRAGTRLFLQDVRRTIEDLERIKPNLRILAQKEAVEVWAPLYDRLVGLFIETVDGELPALAVGPDGRSRRTTDGKYQITGGWPCRRYADDWPARARELLDTCRRQRSGHTLCARPDRRKESFAQLRGYLEKCLVDPRSLTGRDVGKIRLILARYIARHGVPDSPRCTEARAIQRQEVGAPLFRDIARIVVRRLQQHPGDSGLDDPAVAAQPVTSEEAASAGVADGTSVPPPVLRKLQRCLTESLDVLVARGIITSADTLARLLPQITAELRAAGFADPALRRLHAAIYRAFRKRRSLLLFDLQSQIRIEELPWIAAIDGLRRDNLPARELARQTLEEVTMLTVTSFPHAIIPNKLLQELRTLAKEARLALPLVDEVAADIFTGRFSATFHEAARRAATVLEGTLYERYYGIDYRQVRQPPAPPVSRPWWLFWRRRLKPDSTADWLAELCARRAGVALGGWDPATNGMIIEQQQILTSQNLAVLFGALGLADKLRGQLEDLARDCFTWICRRQQVFSTDRHADLIMLKNTAYAWRQMVFLLALLATDRVRPFVSWAEAHLAQQPATVQTRFGPALRGLALAAEGRSLDDASADLSGARRFLGWSKETHWMLS